MVDTYDKNAENRKKFKKNHGDGEDPIIIAQRFLNIFRQLHIFSKERKEAFNKMILEQPPEIRGMFSSLPGGSLLQEYVDDLEQSVGVVRDHSAEFTQDTTSPELKEELSKAKILATALAEAQAQANARIQSMPEQPAFAPQATATPVMSGNVKVVADSSFAKEIAAAFSQALKYSEEKTQIGNKQLAAAVIASQEKMAKVFAEKTDTTALTKSLIESQEKMAQALADNALALQKLPIKSLGGGKETSFVSANGSNQEILDAIRESQDRMAQMIMQHNNLAASNSSNNNANNIQINTTPMPPVEDMVKGIVKAQSELFKEMARTQTKELSAIISVALKESQQLSSKTIAEAIEKVQRENRKFFEVHSKDFSLSSVKQTDQEKESNNSLHRIPSSFDEKEDFQIPEVNPSSEDEEFAELFSGKNVVKPDDQEDITDSVSHDISSEENITEILENEENSSKKKKKKKKKKNKNTEEKNRIDFSLFEDGAQAATKIKDGLSSLASSLFKKESDEKKENDIEDFSFQELPNVDDFDISAEAEKSPSELIDGENEISSHEAQTNTETFAESLESDKDIFSNSDVDFSNREIITKDETTAENDENTFSVPAPEDFDTYTNDTLENYEEETLEEAQDAPQEIISEPEQEDSEDNGLDAQTDATAEDGEDWVWDYEEETPEEAQDAPQEIISEPEQEANENNGLDTQADANAEDGEDWVWDYEEEAPEEAQDVSQEAISEPEQEDSKDNELDTQADTNAEDGEDWVWDYEEETPEDAQDAPQEIISEPEQEANEDNGLDAQADATAEDGEDWVWDYEEEAPEEAQDVSQEAISEPEQEDSEDNELDTQADTTAEDGEDWVWDYEEETSEEAQNAPQEAISEPEQEDSEDNELDTQADTTAEDGEDWVWDYEEETPEEAQDAPQETISKPEQEDSEDNGLDAQTDANAEDGEDWVWDYEEEAPEEARQDDELSEKQNMNFADTSLESVNTGKLKENTNPLYSGDLIFQDNLYKSAENDMPLSIDNLDLGIAEISKDKDSKEPYTPKDDIVG